MASGIKDVILTYNNGTGCFLIIIMIRIATGLTTYFYNSEEKEARKDSCFNFS